MRFGHFDDVKREYVITTPKTPYPWINYLGTEDFFACGRFHGNVHQLSHNPVKRTNRAGLKLIHTWSMQGTDGDAKPSRACLAALCYTPLQNLFTQQHWRYMPTVN